MFLEELRTFQNNKKYSMLVNTINIYANTLS